MTPLFGREPLRSDNVVPLRKPIDMPRPHLAGISIQNFSEPLSALGREPERKRSRVWFWLLAVALTSPAWWLGVRAAVAWW